MPQCSIARQEAIGTLADDLLNVNPDINEKQFFSQANIPKSERAEAKVIFNERKRTVGGLDYIDRSELNARRSLAARKLVSTRDAAKKAVQSAKDGGYNLTDAENFIEKLTLQLGKSLNIIKKKSEFVFGKGRDSKKLSDRGWYGRVEQLTGLKFKEFDLYAKAKHALERNERGKEIHDQWWNERETWLMNKYAEAKTPATRKKYSDLIDEHASLETDYKVKGGFTNERAREILADNIYEGKEQALRDAYLDFKKNVIDARIDNQVEIGQMTQENGDLTKAGGSTQYDTQFEWYIPLEVDKDVLAASTVDGTARQASTGAVKSIKREGEYLWENQGVAERENPWSVAIARYNASEINKEKNNTMKSVRDFVQKVGDSRNVKIGKVQYKPKLDKYGNLVAARDVRNESKIKNSLYFYEDGQRFYIEFTPPNGSEVHPMIEAFRMNPRLVTMFDSIKPSLDKVLNIYRQAFTSANPFFGLRNFFRDFFEININVDSIQSETGKSGLRKAFLKKIPQTSNILAKRFLGLKMTESEQARLDNFFASGAPITFANYEGFAKDVEAANKLLEDLNNPDSIRTGPIPFSAGKKLIKFLNGFNDIFELTNRMALYESLKDSGLSDQKAAFESRTTADFEDKGGWAPKLGTVYLFYNAGVKGIERAFKTIGYDVSTGKIKRPKRLTKMVGALAGMGFAMRMAGHMLNGEEECPTIYNKLKTDNNILLPIPGYKCKFITLPKPYSVFRVPFMVGEYAADTAFGKEEFDALTLAGRAMTTAMKAVDPIGFSDQGSNVVPTLARPLAQTINNENWAGGEIVPGYFADDKTKPFSTKTWESDSELSKDLSKFLNNIDALEAANPTFLSPIALDYLFNAYLNVGVISEINRGLFKDKREATKKDEDGKDITTGVDNPVEAIYELLIGNDVSKVDKKDPDKLFQSFKTDPFARSFFSDEETEERSLRFTIERLVNSVPSKNLTESQYKFILENFDKVQLGDRRKTELRNDIQTKFNDRIKELGLPDIGKVKGERKRKKEKEAKGKRKTNTRRVGKRKSD